MEFKDVFQLFYYYYTVKIQVVRVCSVAEANRKKNKTNSETFEDFLWLWIST